MILTANTSFGNEKQRKLFQAANLHINSWEQNLSLRIRLQKSIDAANKLPVGNSMTILCEQPDCKTNQSEISKESKTLLRNLTASLVELAGEDKRMSKNISLDEDWNILSTVITKKMRPRWENVLNKWHSRLNFGSEKVKSGLKVFNYTIWDQVFN